MLAVYPSGYYAWRNAPVTKQAQENHHLPGLIKQSTGHVKAMQQHLMTTYAIGADFRHIAGFLLRSICYEGSIHCSPWFAEDETTQDETTQNG